LGLQQPFRAKVSSERDEHGIYHRSQRLVASRPRLKSAFTMGIVCGILLFGVAFGIPMAYIVGETYGVSTGIVVEVIFSILGLGLGTACGLIFIYVYALGPILTFWIEHSSEITLQRVGVALTILGILLALLQHFIS
jgi:hypothetical protein